MSVEVIAVVTGIDVDTGIAFTVVVSGGELVESPAAKNDRESGKKRRAGIVGVLGRVVESGLDVSRVVKRIFTVLVRSPGAEDTDVVVDEVSAMELVT